MASGRGSMEWSSMPSDLLLAVFALLTFDADRVRFRAVCSGWAAAASTWRPRPWLVGSRTDRSGQADGAISSFWLAPSGRLVPFPAAVPAGLEYLSSSHGYLALADPSTSGLKAIVLVNPVSGRRVQLPPVQFFRKWIDVTAVVLSAQPDAAAEWEAVAVGFPTSCLAHYSSATGAWRKLDFSVNGYVGVEHYRGRFYVAFKSQLYVVEVDGDAPAVIPLEHVDGEGGGDGSDDGKRVLETHLVEYDGHLLLVSVHDGVEYSSDDDMDFVVDIGGGGDDTRRTVEVHRVEWYLDGRVRLVREVDLGLNALFLGRNQAFALSPEEFPACRVNCIYLVDRQGHPDGLVRIVDMESQWFPRKETICPDNGRSRAVGWTRRGWFLPHY